MELDLKESLPARIITPYSFREHTYHVVFHKKAVGPFHVETSPYLLEHSMITLGDIKAGNAVVGNIFYSSSRLKCGGSYLLAYSGVFKASLEVSVPKDFSMDLVLKTSHIQVFSRKNRATLIVYPNLKTSIRENLEV